MSFKKEATKKPKNDESSKTKQPCADRIHTSNHQSRSLTLNATDFVESKSPKYHSKQYYLTEVNKEKPVFGQKYSDVTTTLLNVVSFLKEKIVLDSDDLSNVHLGKSLYSAHDVPNCGCVKNFNNELEPSFNDTGYFKPRRKRCEAIKETGNGCVNCGIAYKVANTCKDGACSQSTPVDKFPCVGCRGKRGESCDRVDVGSEIDEIQCVRGRGKSCDRVGGCGVTYRVIGKVRTSFSVKRDKEEEGLEEGNDLDSENIGSNSLGNLKLLSNISQAKNAVQDRAEHKRKENLELILQKAREQKAHLVAEKLVHERKETVTSTALQAIQSVVDYFQAHNPKIEEISFPQTQHLLEPPSAEPLFFSLEEEPVETVVGQTRQAITEGYIGEDGTQKEYVNQQRLPIDFNKDPKGLVPEMVEPEVKGEEEEEVADPYWDMLPVRDVDDLRHLAKRRPNKRTGVNWKEFDEVSDSEL